MQSNASPLAVVESGTGSPTPDGNSSRKSASRPSAGLARGYKDPENNLRAPIAVKQYSGRCRAGQVLKKSPAICRIFISALGRTRTCGLLIRSHFRSRTVADTEGHGETKPRFYGKFRTPRRTGRDKQRHPVAVRLRSKSVYYKQAARTPARG